MSESCVACNDDASQHDEGKQVVVKLCWLLSLLFVLRHFFSVVLI